jgi:LacI family transcriptional regulator
VFALPQGRKRFPGGRAKQLAASVSLQDVAHAAGVSLATASRALNGRRSVADDLRLRVEAAAKALSYVPHASARALASQRTLRVACLLPTIDNTIFARFSEAVQRRFRADGYSMLLSVTDFDRQNEARAIHEMVAAGIDGLVLVGAERDGKLYDFLARRGVSFLLTNIYAPHMTHVQVGYDNAAGAKSLTTYLIDLGHRHIAAIDGPVRDNDRAADRFRGVREALDERGLSMPPNAMVERRFTIEEGRSGLRAIVERFPTVTAVVCGNDILAIGAMLEARAIGLRVPEDLSITGFDDLDLASQLGIGLTTIRVPNREVGALAADTLLAMIGARPVPRIRIVPTSLIVRQSTGEPNAERGLLTA